MPIATDKSTRFHYKITNKTSFRNYFSELWSYRSLIRSFALRDIKVKYAQTYLGILWSAIQSIVGITIISFFFGFILKIDTQEIPYPLFAFPGMISWYFFSFLVGSVGSSLIQSQYIMQKSFFPRMILPLSRSVMGLLDFMIWFLVFLLVAVFYQYPISINIFFLPFFIILNLITGLSIAIWISALTIKVIISVRNPIQGSSDHYSIYYRVRYFCHSGFCSKWTYSRRV